MSGSQRTFSISLPIPDCVTERPPNICVASSAVARPVLVTYLAQGSKLSRQAVNNFKRYSHCLRRAMVPAILSDCSAYDIYEYAKFQASSLEDTREGRTLFIWCVTFSNQFCADSTRAIIWASFARTTAWVLNGLPKACRWFDHLHESTDDQGRGSGIRQ